MTPIVVRPATHEDIAQFSDLANKPTIRAMVAERDGRIIALGGIALSQGRWYAFADLPEEIRPYKMTIARAAKRFFRDLRRDGIRYVYAEASPVEPRALAWFASLGFEFDERSQHYYRWSADARP